MKFDFVLFLYLKVNFSPITNGIELPRKLDGLSQSSIGSKNSILFLDFFPTLKLMMTPKLAFGSMTFKGQLEDI